MTKRTVALTRRTLMRAGGIAALAAMMDERRTDAAPLSPEEAVQIGAVRTFAAGWKENSPDKVVSPFTENCSVRWTAQNLNAAPAVGKPAFLKNVQNALKDQTIEMIVTDMYALGPVVVNVHHQLFDSKTNGKREDLYIGIYFFEHGLIREWIDYAVFDPRPRTTHGPGYDLLSRVTA